jgi:hypothetical protein
VRRALVLVGVAAAVAVGDGDARTGSSCSPAELRLALSTQGAATQSVIFLSMLNRGASACVASGAVRFEVEQAGRRARISGNPLTVRVRVTLIPKRAQWVAHVWWANWCGSRRGLDVAASYGGETIRSRFRTLPVCLSSSRRSTLRLP